MPISRATEESGVPTSAPSPNASARADGHGAADDHAVDMGVDEPQLVAARRCSRSGTSTRSSSVVMAATSLGAGAVADLHHQAASMRSALSWRTRLGEAEDGQRLAVGRSAGWGCRGRIAGRGPCGCRRTRSARCRSRRCCAQHAVERLAGRPPGRPRAADAEPRSPSGGRSRYRRWPRFPGRRTDRRAACARRPLACCSASSASTCAAQARRAGSPSPPASIPPSSIRSRMPAVIQALPRAQRARAKLCRPSKVQPWNQRPVRGRPGSAHGRRNWRTASSTRSAPARCLRR